MKKKFEIILQGVYTKKVHLEAEDASEAEEKAKGGEGNEIESSITGWCEIENIEEIN